MCSSLVAQSILAVAIISVAMVEAAPLDSTKSASKGNTKAPTKTKSYVSAPKTLKRGKRNVILEEMPNEMEEPIMDEQDVLREQLSDLTDDQLAVLAEIVQNEIDQYNPEGMEIGAYEIVELPDYLTQQPMEYMPRDRRSVPIFEPFDENDLPENFDDNQQIIFVPEEALLEAAAEQAEQQELQDELELRQRIAEIASILNERATRRLRFV